MSQLIVLQAVDTRVGSNTIVIKEETKEMSSQPEGNRVGSGFAFSMNGPPLAWVVPDHPNVLIHEVGHLFGCNHAIEESLREGDYKTSNNNYGYYVEGTNKATIMAYPTEAHYDWIPYFSSRDLVIVSRDNKINGMPLGDDKHDNRNQIMKTRFLLSQYGDESGSCMSPK